jgi:hypothetical protein
VALILRRRTFVVNRALQLSILWTSLGHILLLVAVTSTSLFLPLILQLNVAEGNSAAAADAAVRMLYLHNVYWLPVALSLVVIGLHSIWASHKIAGPIYRFGRVCESMTAGVVPLPTRLRKGDQLRPEMDLVNAMLETWRGVAADAQADAARLREALAACQAVGRGAGDASDAAWMDVVRAEAQLAKTLGRVTCERPPAPTAAEAVAAGPRV